MLALSRNEGQEIIIDGKIIVKILRVQGKQVKLGITAPREIEVHRIEIYERIQAGIPREDNSIKNYNLLEGK